ncbi:GNAT family N-acetyltransferase [Streptomyces sp. NPDC085946]|uniref:GNAT family N-acetyltransferase n=1 Tax=Streptomyces sp. NPDC085946 TaxID=3365744 RepID=UPI0037D36B03
MTPPPRLEEITAANLGAALGIRVRPGQEHAVGPVGRSPAEAYAHPGVTRPRLIVDGGRPVGFLTAFPGTGRHGDGTLHRSGLWRLDIAAGEHGKGHGRFAVESVAAGIRRRGGTRLPVSWHPGPDSPEGFRPGLGAVQPLGAVVRIRSRGIDCRSSAPVSGARCV